MNKYEFVPGDEITIEPGRTVKRIRALVAIAAFDVSVGDLGGYVESEKNLAQVSSDARVSSDAWVYGDARVSGNALVYGYAQVSGNGRVYGDARVSGNALVYGDAQVYGDARVSGNALVYGDAQVSGNALVYGDAQVSGNGLIFWASKVGTQNGTLTVYDTKDNALEVTRGCFRGSVDEFLSKSEVEHDDQTHLEYRLLIEVAHSRITRARK